ncbi:hypothetical protein [Mycolicibacterium bacteremicum]|uniref:Uncharacterized protein n=1 Tax=Mycolicibacterium bacteremicum TaxID=564198 RepID=A0A1W9YRR9_MYCBA|nr:hypothetical protein [Mycolicibacterium bacteremicum]MCV7432699.1 hypothetical protein [Mycolicibacterium bacteremicum]ORA02771.1 hypothetical protein BST17_21865 [Mycolicibacterium bacteremicum]
MGPGDYEDYADYPEFDEDDYEEIPPRPSQRVPVGIFLLGWLFLPTAAVLIPGLTSPWHELASFLTLCFIALFVWAVVRVVRGFF